MTASRVAWAAAAVLASAMTVACGYPEAAEPRPESVTDFAALYGANCSGCHGAEGRGDGPSSAALNPKPRNYHDPSWQQAATDEGITKAILEGGAAVGKSAVMPSNPDMVKKPEVVAELVKIVRGFGR